MTAQDRLRQAIARYEAGLRAAVPADRQAAILALLRARDRLPRSPAREPPPDLVTGRRLADLGGNTALRLCLEGDDAAAAPSSSDVARVALAGGAGAVDGDGLDGWSARFLDACGRLVEARLVLGHCETGFMWLADDGRATFDAWIATKRVPTSWRERADIDWWAGWLARSSAPTTNPLAYQLGYPPDAEIGGCTVQVYRDVLGLLTTWTLQARDQGEHPALRSEAALAASLASALNIDPAAAGRALAGFTLDRAGAAYHAAVPGIAAAPLVWIGPDRLVWSVYGLTTEPLFFMLREIRRRDGQAYHNSAHLREGVFRQDLYALFQDRRFVTSAGRVELRRAAGDVHTDIDALVFDKKREALAFFELKSQDPFARSTAELGRQRDNVLYANRQISGVLNWVQRHSADALLARIDPRAAKTFRVQKVYPFVLGRYLAHFTDGPEPDRRAAWGTWPQLLHLLDGRPVRAAEANPLASLFTRLAKDVHRIGPSTETPSREIDLGGARLTVHSSYAAFQTRETHGRTGGS